MGAKPRSLVYSDRPWPKTTPASQSSLFLSGPLKHVRMSRDSLRYRSFSAITHNYLNFSLAPASTRLPDSRDTSPLVVV